MLIETCIAGRPYPIQAIRSILEGLEERRRKFLLVMATGTGKTRTNIALVDVLMRARWISRVLFLVDRIELRNQAVEAFYLVYSLEEVREPELKDRIWEVSGLSDYAGGRGLQFLLFCH